MTVKETKIMSDHDAKFGADGPGTVTIPEVVIQPYPTIKKGSRGPTVAKWQRMIGVEADGNFGSQTDAVTRQWQTDHGLSPDGVVGVASWAKALETTSPTGMLALEWNQASPEIPSPPAPSYVIPPVAGAVPLGTSGPVQGVTFKAPPVVKTPAVQEAGFMGFLSGLPTWGKALLGIGVAAGVVQSARKGHFKK